VKQCRRKSFLVLFSKKELLAFALLLAPPAEAAPHDDFSRAVAYDLAGDQAHAFDLYLSAARAGVAEAQFNVAVMYDSGRGTRHDALQAALFYAFAAVNGNARAAYNLGMLYETGDGVSRNVALARAWYRKASEAGLQAAAEKLHGVAVADSISEKAVPAFPAEGATLGADGGFVPFVWLAGGSGLYYVQIVRVEAGAAHDVLTQVVDVSATRAPIGHAPGEYAWRVFSFAPAKAAYVSTDWVRFSVK
jgi:hypothetical protein